MAPILKIENVSKHFGGLTALSNITLEAQKAKIVGIIGPNGAGKTTLFNCLTGLYYLSEGRILFEDKSIVPTPSEAKRRLMLKIANAFLILSLLWTPLFWAFFFDKAFFKVELTLLAVFLMSLRWLVYRGFRDFRIWAWSVMFVFLIADGFFAGWCLAHPKSLGLFPGTKIPLAYFAFPWSGVTLVYCVYTFWQLLIRRVRQLFGFRLGPDAICNLGIARTFQNIRLFLNLSVLDNVRIGRHILLHSGVFRTLFRTAAQRDEEENTINEALAHLQFVGLGDRYHLLAGAMAYGEQRRLEIARAMASKPKLILLDEPAAGMNPQESSRLIELIRKIKDRGITILIIEHDMKVMMNLADTIYVMDHGEMIACGAPEEIRNNPKVIEAYLGGSMAHAKTG